MNEKDKKSDYFLTVEELADLIPPSWRAAVLAIGCSNLDKVYAVRRLALHQNASGRKVVVIYSEEIKRAD